MSHFGALENAETPSLPPFPPAPVAQAERAAGPDRAPKTERRRSPRLPLTEPVKVGPPQGKAAATVSAVDLSAHGLFIDADRPVRVGARFSLEIPLPGGERIYVPEAEVAYNRTRPKGNGFGVRFVACPPGVLLKIAGALEAAAPPPMPMASMPMASPSAPTITRLTVPKEDTISELPTLAPQPRPVISARPAMVTEKPTMISEKPASPPMVDASMKMSLRPVDLSEYPEPEIVGEELVTPTAIPKPSMIAVANEQPLEEPITEKIFHLLADARGRLADRTRALPRLWTGLCAAGSVTIFAAIALTLYTGSSAEAVEPSSSAVERGVSSRTHHALMGGPSMAEVGVTAEVEAAPGNEVAPKKPLPPLVMIEEPAQAVTPSPEVAVAERPAPTVIVQKKVPVAPEAPKVAAVVQSEPSRPTARTGTLSIGIAKGARVLRTHTLKSPDRFVIDLVGQADAPKLPAAAGRIKALRAGKHPEYTRIVLDSVAPISSGTAQKDGDRLLLTLRFD